MTLLITGRGPPCSLLSMLISTKAYYRAYLDLMEVVQRIQRISVPLDMCWGRKFAKKKRHPKTPI